MFNVTTSQEPAVFILRTRYIPATALCCALIRTEGPEGPRVTEVHPDALAFDTELHADAATMYLSHYHIPADLGHSISQPGGYAFEVH